MKKQILIVDSDKKQVKRIVTVLQKAIYKWGGEAEIFLAATIPEADCITGQKTMDLIIIVMEDREISDEEYPEIEWVKILRGIKKYVALPIVFLASKMDAMKYAYMELNCLGYLPRAFDSKELFYVLKKSMNYRTWREEENVLILRNKGVLYPVKVKDIVYVETIERILHVYQVNKAILKISHKPMADILQEAKTDCLLQCSKNLLVNKRYVTEVNLKQRYLKAEGEAKKLFIGKKYTAGVRSFMESREWVYMHVK